jgi:hypothetical protein
MIVTRHRVIFSALRFHRSKWPACSNLTDTFNTV